MAVGLVPAGDPPPAWELPEGFDEFVEPSSGTLELVESLELGIGAEAEYCAAARAEAEEGFVDELEEDPVPGSLARTFFDFLAGSCVLLTGWLVDYVELNSFDGDERDCAVEVVTRSDADDVIALLDLIAEEEPVAGGVADNVWACRLTWST